MQEGAPRDAQWRESVDLFWYEELNDFLEITLHDHDVGGKDDYMGRYKNCLCGTPGYELPAKLCSAVEFIDSEWGDKVNWAGGPVRQP